MKQLNFCLLLTLAFVGSGLAQSRISKIPSGLVSQIYSDINCCEYEGGKTEFQKYLTAKTIDLNNDKQVEYIVEGDDMGKCISGNKFHSI